MNWQKIISDLHESEARMTQQQIADAVGLSQATVSELAAGKIKVPKWDTGEALRRLHKSVMAKPKRTPKPAKVD